VLPAARSLYPDFMVRFTVLASGSKGNSAIVSGGRTRILVDAGLSCRELFRRMKLAGEDPATLSAIIITHEHQDHVNGLAVTARKLGIPVYFTEATHRAWMRWLTPRRQMTYAQWLEQSRKQAAEREAEPLSAVPDCESTDSDPEEIEAGISTQKIEAIEPTNSTPEAAPDDPSSVKEDPTWLPAVEYFEAGHSFAIGDIGIDAFTTPHDAADPVGFVFRSEGIRLGFATDLGYVTPNIKANPRASI
jgi:phosphoribosyl 1,2-cyclic phosphodiesterase